MSEVTEKSLMIVGGIRRGRPCRAGVRSDHALRVWLTEDERSALGRMSDMEGRKMAEIVRDAVNEYVSDFGERRVFRTGPFE